MPRKKLHSFSISLSDEQRRWLEKYRKEKGYRSLSETVRTIIEEKAKESS